jgi:hypothetical protein
MKKDRNFFVPHVSREQYEWQSFSHLISSSNEHTHKKITRKRKKIVVYELKMRVE